MGPLQRLMPFKISQRDSPHRWIGLKEKNYRKAPWFPVDFPWNHSIESSHQSRSFPSRESCWQSAGLCETRSRLKQSGDCKNVRLYQLPNRNKLEKEKICNPKRTHYALLLILPGSMFLRCLHSKKTLVWSLDHTSLNAQAIAQTLAMPPSCASLGILFSGVPQ